MVPSASALTLSAVSASGARPEPFKPTSFFALGSHTSANRSPPRPFAVGSIKPRHAFTAIAASTALPPGRKTGRPAGVESGGPKDRRDARMLPAATRPASGMDLRMLARRRNLERHADMSAEVRKRRIGRLRLAQEGDVVIDAPGDPDLRIAPPFTAQPQLHPAPLVGDLVGGRRGNAAHDGGRLDVGIETIDSRAHQAVPLDRHGRSDREEILGVSAGGPGGVRRLVDRLAIAAADIEHGSLGAVLVLVVGAVETEGHVVRPVIVRGTTNRPTCIGVALVRAAEISGRKRRA